MGDSPRHGFAIAGALVLGFVVLYQTADLLMAALVALGLALMAMAIAPRD
jgi:hypothetical protein